MLDGLRRYLEGQGSCASLRYHNEGTPAFRQLNNSLPRNISCYQYLSSGKSTSYNSIVVIIGDLTMDFMTVCHIHGLKKQELQSDSYHCQLTWWTGAHTNRYTWLTELFTPLELISATKTESSPFPGTTFELDCGYHPGLRLSKSLSTRLVGLRT